MKLVIAEYLRTLKERDELDRLLPDLLVEMGYVPVARPQTGNRQYGVDLAARGKNPETDLDELLLLVIKQGDIGRTEWDVGNQAVRQSINEILDVYLKSHIEPQDKDRKIRIIVTTNGELKQVIQASWCGFVEDNQTKVVIEFWGIDRLAELIERHLLDEHVFRDEDRKQLRRALALSGDSDYDRRDLHRLFLRTLGLSNTGALEVPQKSGKALLKAIRIVSLSAHAFASWSLNDGDARQGLQANERALLWVWHRIQLADEETRNEALADAFGSLWTGYLNTARGYFERLQGHCYVEDGLFGYCSDSAQFSVIAFELIGMLATIGLAQVLVTTDDEADNNARFENARIVADALSSLIQNNGICSSPCLDRHSQDITLAVTFLLLTENADKVKTWLHKLVRNIDYAYKTKKYIPVCTDSLDDLAEEGGWSGGQAAERLINTSWTLATLAGWCAILGLDDGYEVIARECKESYPEVCVQLWHPDADVYKHMYFAQAQFNCGAAEAPIELPQSASAWRDHIKTILRSNQAQIAAASAAKQARIPALDIIAYRHYSAPVAPYFWYQFVNVLYPEDTPH
ncbi:hypothetical protein [Thiobacillus sp.]